MEEEEKTRAAVRATKQAADAAEAARKNKQGATSSSNYRVMSASESGKRTVMFDDV